MGDRLAKVQLLSKVKIDLNADHMHHSNFSWKKHDGI